MKIGSIGCGNMAMAILAGIIKKGVAKPDEIIASARHKETLEKAEETLGIHTTLDNKETAKAEILLLSTEPSVYPTVIDEVKDIVSDNTIIWTIAAGVTIKEVQECFGRPMKVVRTMPNTPVKVGAGVIGVTPNEAVTEEDMKKISACIESIGGMEIIPESLIDGIIPVTGSSPAFIYMLIEAMADGAVREGFPRAQAIRLAAQTVLGTAQMVLETGTHPAILKDEVCTPGGITIELVKKMEEMGFRNAILEGMEACNPRK